MKFAALVFEGGPCSGKIESWVCRVREELCLDLMRRLGNLGIFDAVIAVTDRPDLARRAEVEAGAVASLGEAQTQFHFGRRLAELVQEFHVDAFVYISGGAGALMSTSELASFAAISESVPDAIVANNIYSADMFGCACAKRLIAYDIPGVDNQIPMWAASKGMRPVGLEPTVGASFDIDTPADLMVLSEVIPSIRPELEHVAGEIASGPIFRAKDAFEGVRRCLATDLAEIALFGRVSPVTVNHLNSTTRCRIRAYSEERGMRAFGRDVPGGAKSLIAKLMEGIGFPRFFEGLAWCADAALFDTRVFFSHMGADLSAEERFASDLFLWEQVGHEGVAEFTRAAHDVGIPVVLGGHCLVSGGVRALAESGRVRDVV